MRFTKLLQLRSDLDLAYLNYTKAVKAGNIKHAKAYSKVFKAVSRLITKEYGKKTNTEFLSDLGII